MAQGSCMKLLRLVRCLNCWWRHLFQCIVWNVEAAEPINVFSSTHNDTIFSINWNREGSLFTTTCKDKRVRVLDPRLASVAIVRTLLPFLRCFHLLHPNFWLQETQSHQGSKASKSVFLRNDRLFTCGFSKSLERQLHIWDLVSILNIYKHLERLVDAENVLARFSARCSSHQKPLLSIRPVESSFRSTISTPTSSSSPEKYAIPLFLTLPVVK